MEGQGNRELMGQERCTYETENKIGHIIKILAFHFLEGGGGREGRRKRGQHYFGFVEGGGDHWLIFSTKKVTIHV